MIQDEVSDDSVAITIAEVPVSIAQANPSLLRFSKSSDSAVQVGRIGEGDEKFPVIVRLAIFSIAALASWAALVGVGYLIYQLV